MIATLNGMVAEKLDDIVVLDVRGIGYGLLVTTEDYGRLATGQTAKVYIHEHIREQAHDLFGFCQLDTKKLFELLLGVNGVGPKMALSVLSVGNTNDVRAAIATGDVKFIQRASGEEEEARHFLSGNDEKPAAAAPHTRRRAALTAHVNKEAWI